MAGSSDEVHRRYYQDCVARWSEERYALNKRFVQLTLLLDQGEDTPGPRWRRAPVTLHDLGEVLEQVPEPAVVLGPPESGKSTLLRHYELDCAHAALAGLAGADLSQTPLTFMEGLSAPARAGLCWDSRRVFLPPSRLQRHPVVEGAARAAGAYRALV